MEGEKKAFCIFMGTVALISACTLLVGLFDNYAWRLLLPDVLIFYIAWIFFKQAEK